MSSCRKKFDYLTSLKVLFVINPCYDWRSVRGLRYLYIVTNTMNIIIYIQAIPHKPPLTPLNTWSSIWLVFIHVIGVSVLWIHTQVIWKNNVVFLRYLRFFRTLSLKKHSSCVFLRHPYLIDNLFHLTRSFHFESWSQYCIISSFQIEFVSFN